MRPTSEIHSALDMVDAELAQGPNEKLQVVRDVLAWVAGAHWTDLTDGPNPWLVAYLLDDPPKLDDTPPEVN
jgi:hypothetical protein